MLQVEAVDKSFDDFMAVYGANLTVAEGELVAVIGPNGAYVFVATIYTRDWLEFDDSVVIIGELARMAWNHFNPQALMATTNAGIVPDVCDWEASPAINALMSANLPMVGP